jgi:hypothetical protein
MGKQMNSRRFALVAVLISAFSMIFEVREMRSQEGKIKYPHMAPIADYLMTDRNAEIALTRSAAPESISQDATVLVLGGHGYETVVEGKNGFVCIVERSWMSTSDDPEFWNARIRGPVCYNPLAARSILLAIVYKKTELVLADLSKEQFTEWSKTAYAKGEFPPFKRGSMSYMMSKHAYLNDVGSYNLAHLMLYTPLTDGANWGAGVENSPIILGERGPPEPFTMFIVPVGKWSDNAGASNAVITLEGSATMNGWPGCPRTGCLTGGVSSRKSATTSVSHLLSASRNEKPMQLESIMSARAIQDQNAISPETTVPEVTNSSPTVDVAIAPPPPVCNPNLRMVVERARDQLRQLTLQRREITQRIAIIKRTVNGLALLYDVELQLWPKNGAGIGRRHGITNACRVVLNRADRFLSTDEIYAILREEFPDLFCQPGNPRASLVTILNRLVKYGEAGTFLHNGGRFWQGKHMSRLIIDRLDRPAREIE